MTKYTVSPNRDTLFGYYSREEAPVQTIQPGDSVTFQTLDARWSQLDNPDPWTRPPLFEDHAPDRMTGHALCGPVAIAGAEPGMIVEVRFKSIRPGTWGWTRGGGADTDANRSLGVADEPSVLVGWEIDADKRTARNKYGHRIKISPFMGNFGFPDDAPDRQPTLPPRACGGNIDCKELVEGSAVFLPVTVPGGLFYIGDGHAAQGDGEASGTGVECPMERVEVEFALHPAMKLDMLQANTPAGWVTFGFDEDLNKASLIALGQMVDVIAGRSGVDRKYALVLASVAVDLRISQIVNGVKGVHAVLPHDAIVLDA